MCIQLIDVATDRQIMDFAYISSLPYEHSY